MAELHDYFVFQIESHLYAVDLPKVDQVVRAVELIHFPRAPDIVPGLMNFYGKIVPVFDLNLPLQLPRCRMGVDDRIVVARASSRTVAFVVNAIEGVFEFKTDQIDTSQDIFSELSHFILGVAAIDHHEVLILDLDRLLPFQDLVAIGKIIESNT